MTNALLILIYVAASLGLLVYSANCYVLLTLFLRRRENLPASAAGQRIAAARFNDPANLPLVTTQIPVFNEANVAERAMRAAAAIDYPRARHEIQVLDDSTDETCDITQRVARELLAAGHRIVVLRRTDRRGFKAGALAAGLRVAAGEFIAIFDADFVPPPDFLRRTVPFFLADPRIGIVQARWGHLNDGESLLTRAQAIGIDGHFMIEQSARTFNGLLMNFNGTAGVWRRAAIDGAGGWADDTLTEDLDLSYRAQLAGWRAHFVADLAAPAELPSSVAAFKSQQFRWAKGSIQTARKLLPQIWRSDFSWWVKVQATLHLTHYAVHPLMLILAVLAVPVMWRASVLSPAGRAALGGLVLFSMMAPNSLYLLSQRLLYPRWLRRVCWFPALMCIGTGMTVSNTRAVLEALLGRPSEFVRTPKRGDRAQSRSYRVPATVLPWIELILGVYCAGSLVFYLDMGKYLLGPFLFIYATGFLAVGAAGLWEARAVDVVQRAAPAPNSALPTNEEMDRSRQAA